MGLRKSYDPNEAEPRLQAYWEKAGVYNFSEESAGEVYAIDTPPPTVSGNLHLGHTYSYTHTDLIARFQRMRGEKVFYPMGYDDNGLPTERLVERQLGVTAKEIGRQAFIEKCLEVSEQAEKDYQALWKRLGLSIDWRYSYRTIDDLSRRTAQFSFIDLYQKGLVYRQKAPAIWCPECQTAIAQAELNDLERQTQFVTLSFKLGNGKTLPIATTRPELLPACVAIFVHPEDQRYQDLIGKQVSVPFYNQIVRILADTAADPEKGTGAVMCCTFGDTTDKAWWYAHQLPLVEAIDREGRMTQAAGKYAGLSVSEARQAIVKELEEEGLLTGRSLVIQSVRVHERCDTPVEYILAEQWFIRVLDFKKALLEAGEKVSWHPEHMRARYRSWVENLTWDWGISRQRYFGVPFPAWYCQECGEMILADPGQLPVDPTVDTPSGPCACGSTNFTPEQDVFDTWMTSSMSPQIVGRWLPGREDPDDQLFERVFPFSLRPQAHEIIRTWAFYTIAKSLYHLNEIPWKDLAISGWGIAGEGMGKVSKSRGGGPMAPLEMIERYSADAVRYWAASTGLGKDAIISEEKIQIGAKLVTKLWNVARFSERFLEDYEPPAIDQPNLLLETGGTPVPACTPSPIRAAHQGLPLTPADHWILSRTQRLIRRVTELMENFDYAAAKSEIESFFWTELADNYLEMAKHRLYDPGDPQREGAQFALYQVLLAVIRLLAPFLPYVTEEIYQGLYAEGEPGEGKNGSIHKSAWPVRDERLEDELAERAGEALVEIATAIRRYKSERSLPLSTELARLQLASNDPELAQLLLESHSDLTSITRARQIQVIENLDKSLEIILIQDQLRAAVEPLEREG